MVRHSRRTLRVLLGGMSSWRADVLSELLGTGDALTIVGKACEARALIAATAALSPDVVLLSLGEPGASVLDTTRQLCAAAPGTRVVLLGDEEEEKEEYQVAAHAAGASAYLPWLAPRPVLLSTVWGASGTSATDQLRSV